MMNHHTFTPQIISADNQHPTLDAIDTWQLRNDLLKSKAIVVRGFDTQQDDFVRFTEQLGGNFLPYQGGAFERTSLNQNKTLMTVTASGQRFDVPFHGEMYYSNTPPDLLFFYCEQAPSTGGETTVCQSHDFYNALSGETKDIFLNYPITYTRTYNKDRWTQIFQTSERGDVEAYCAKKGLTCHFQDEDQLQTTYTTQALRNRDGKTLFINNIIPVLTQERLWKSQDSIVHFSNGEPIPDNIFDELRNVSHKVEYAHNWQRHDILIVDNRYLMHGRKEIIDSARSILVRMCNYE